MISHQPSSLTAYHTFRALPSGPQTCFHALQFVLPQSLCLGCTTRSAADRGCDTLLIACLSPTSLFSLTYGAPIFFFTYGTDICSGKEGPSTWTMIVLSHMGNHPISLYSDWFRGSMWSSSDKWDLRGSLLGASGKDFSSWDLEKMMLSPLLPAFECSWECDSHLVTMWRKLTNNPDVLELRH